MSVAYSGHSLALRVELYADAVGRVCINCVQHLQLRPATYTPKERYEIGKYAAEFGNTGAVKHAKTKYGYTINESSVRSLKQYYLKELNRKYSSIQETQELPMQNRGRPLLLGDELDAYIADYIRKLRMCGGIVNRSLVIASAYGSLNTKNRLY